MKLIRKSFFFKEFQRINQTDHQQQSNKLGDKHQPKNKLRIKSNKRYTLGKNTSKIITIAIKGSRKKSYSLNGRAIKALPPPRA